LSSSSACTITKNTCSLNNEYGIRLYYSSACTIEKNTISENRVGIYLESFSFTPNVNTAHYNNIFNNTEYGIRVPGYFGFGYTINATYNWWGNESGPYHSVNNPNGKGDNVTDYVIFDPWLREPYTEKANRNVDEKTKTVSLFWSFVGFMIALSVIVVWIWFTKKRKSGMEYITDTQLGRTGVKRLKKHHWMIIGGTVLLVIGIVISIIMFTLLFKDPSEEAVWEGTYAEGEKADKKVFLDAGKYDVWSKDYDPGEVVIKDSNGRVVFRDSIGTNYEKITINGVVYVKVGSFKAEKQDTYTVTVEQASTLYITPPIKVSGIIESVCGGVIISIIGGILLVAGIIFWFKEKKKIPQHGQHQMQPYQQPPQRVQPQHLCPKCGSPLSYHHVKMNGEEYNKWYCYQCEEYAPE
ncbi:MAG: right-handed parallel beta-helix repeat-containing protein, partial [Thermoplasmata archaeon]|nr:right-handed parallel beta-helix repeat-containing protein [Thermoplasmata archaeon]